MRERLRNRLLGSEEYNHLVPLLQLLEGALEATLSNRDEAVRRLEELEQLPRVRQDVIENSPHWVAREANAVGPDALTPLSPHLRRMVVRLYRSCQSQAQHRTVFTTHLRYALQGELGPNITAPSSPEELDALLSWEREQEIGRYRLLLPVASGNDQEWKQACLAGRLRGGLVWAEVTAILRGAQPRWCVPYGPLFLTPWTWFNLIDSSQSGSFTDIRAHLIDALCAVNILSRETDGSVCLIRGQEQIPITLLVSLYPLEPSAFCGSRGHESSSQEDTPQWLARQLSPWVLQLAGPSLGVTLALTVVAASQRLSVRPLIATGQVASAGVIGPVGHEVAKAEAINAFLNHARCRNWQVIVPVEGEWHSLEQPPVSRSRLHSLLEDVSHFLTDGFDECRRQMHLAQSEAPQRAGLHWRWRKLEGARQIAEAEPPNGYGPTDVARAEQVRNTLTRWLNHRRRGDASDPPSYGPHPVCVPFNEDPRVLADWLAQEWWKCLPSSPSAVDESYLLPVIVPVPLVHNQQPSWTDQQPLHQRLAAAIQARFEADTPSDNAVRIALSRPDKLVLVLYPPSSVKWWQELMKHEERWQQVWHELCALAAPGQHHREQIVVVVYSDVHHNYCWAPRDDNAPGSGEAVVFRSPPFRGVQS